MHYPLDKYFKLYSDCAIISGYQNSILLDFTRSGMSNFVPKELGVFIDQCINRTLEEVLINYSLEEKKLISGYLDFMIENDFGFFVSERMKNNFPPINSNLKNSPEIIDNLIIEFDSKNITYLKSIHLLIDACLISSIEIRGINLSIEELELIVQSFSSSAVQSINIYLNSTSENMYIETLNEIRFKNDRIKKLIVFENKQDITSADGITRLLATKMATDEITRVNITNLSYHIESQNVCTFRYKKLFIDKEGEMKNHPNSNKLIGNIVYDEISTLIDNLKSECESNKNWYITRTQINVCKDCEFRTVCFTNNLPIRDKSNKYYLKTECTYNPYIGKAIGEEGYQTLAACGVISNENGFSIDHKKIAKINAKLWSEE